MKHTEQMRHTMKPLVLMLSTLALAGCDFDSGSPSDPNEAQSNSPEMNNLDLAVEGLFAPNEIEIGITVEKPDDYDDSDQDPDGEDANGEDAEGADQAQQTTLTLDQNERGKRIESDLVEGSEYAFELLSLPARQHCEFTDDDAEGTMAGEDVTVSVACDIPEYELFLDVRDLADEAQLVFEINEEPFELTGSGVTMAQQLAHNEPYEVTLTDTPANQNCAIDGDGEGQIDRGDETVRVDCGAVQVSPGGEVLGLPDGQSLTLTVVGTSTTFSVDENGDFTADDTNLDFGSEYELEVTDQPEASRCQIAEGDSGEAGEALEQLTLLCFPAPEIVLEASNERLLVEWNRGAFETFEDMLDVTLCAASDPIEGDVAGCDGANSELVTDPPQRGVIAEGFPNGEPTNVQVVLDFADGVTQLTTDELTITPRPIERNTGLTECFGEADIVDGAENGADGCPDEFYTEQDASRGRDWRAVNDELIRLGEINTDNGFDFSGVTGDGEIIPAGNSEEPVCAIDHANNRMWEIRRGGDGLRDAGHTYSWFEPGHSSNFEGTEDGGDCDGINCDTSSYVSLVNNLKLCGFDDWRLPTPQELYALIDQNQPRSLAGPIPHLSSDEYQIWTDKPRDIATNEHAVLGVFNDEDDDEVRGELLSAGTEFSSRVLLVRDAQAQSLPVMAEDE